MEIFLKLLKWVFSSKQAPAAQESPPPPVVQPELVPAAETPKPGPAPLTRADLLKGRDKQYAADFTQEISDNLDKLLIILNKLQAAYGKRLPISSGWRPPAVNEATSNAAKKSNHLKGLAVDIADADGDFMRWCLSNLELMKELGVWFEDFRWTPTWTHCQIVPPGSGRRVYVPSTAPAPAPTRWAGTYDQKFD